ncbi:hypothetical protein IGB42_03341 [Andreprevotia sp. IGB-42]|uniref:DUF1700 domain-containing protein n=1 Tax=Andreprevotia sp. IGB-42 TaxID=2497473 RepID=UPI00135B4B94|nr:DUF1700 domain-containing protein [Andreprevotia sp. IGB-42]KAF0812064.1 hypothetical protein IGB42_03341 [Andreprevotia sp. IGB-42]
MNEQSYTHALEQALAGLPRAVIDEALADCREYFREALAEGRSEEDVARALGDPQQLARELRARSSITRWEQQKSFGSLWGVIAATAGLGLLNFVLAVPFLIYLSLLTAALVLSFSVALGGLLLTMLWAGNALFDWPGDQYLLSGWQRHAAVSQEGGNLAINIQGDEGERVLISNASGAGSIHIESPDGSVHIETGQDGSMLLLSDGEQQFRLQGLMGRHGKQVLLGLGAGMLILGSLTLLLCAWLARLTLRVASRYFRYQLSLFRSASTGVQQQSLARS